MDSGESEADLYFESVRVRFISNYRPLREPRFGNIGKKLVVNLHIFNVV